MFSLKNVHLSVLLLVCITANAQDGSCSAECTCNERPDFHAPVGVMLDHAHDKGQWMVSYRYMNSLMKGNLEGARAIGADEIFTRYISQPEKMTMQMHMLMLMYGLSDRFTVMAMGSYMVNDMSMNMAMYGMMNMSGGSMEMPNGVMQMKDRTQGLGDTKFYLLVNLFSSGHHELLLSNGLSVPTGNIAMSGNAMGYDQRKPYSMQLGSGTFAWLPGLTYTGRSDLFSWGVQAAGAVNLGVNKYNYSYGNSVTSTAWLAGKWNDWLSSSLRGEFSATGTMYGYDKLISPYRTTDPQANSKNYGGRIASAYAGLNFLIPKGPLKGNRLSVEYGLPVYQYVNGLQMKATQTLYAGWQLSF